jgi:hypothetical protein
MRQITGICVIALVLATAGVSSAQTTQPKPATPPSDTRPVTTTTSGDTGLWLVPTADVLRNKKWSFSINQVNMDDGQGFTDANRFPLTFAVGLGDRAEVFGNWSAVVRVDRDTNPLFYTSTAREATTGTGGGIQPDFPLIKGGWSGSKVGDAWFGGKVRLFGIANNPFGVAVRGQVKIPVGDDAIGVSSGKVDFQIDGIVSTYYTHVELTGFGGYLVRGDPEGYTLTGGIRWGVGIAFPNILRSGFRGTAELGGEHYLTNPIGAPAGLTGDDGSSVPTSTYLKDPLVATVGLTWQASNGFSSVECARGTSR